MTGDGSTVLAELLAEHGPKLSRASRAIAEHLAAVPVGELPFLSAEQIARATGTSDVSVTRAARSLGFTGLPELKRVATREHRRSTPSGERMTQQLAALGPDLADGLPKIYEAAREAIADSAQVISPGEVAAAVSLVTAADTVWCVGVGTAGAAALHLADVLGRTGVRTRWTRATGFDLANTLVGLRAGDAVVLFHAATPLPDVDALVGACAATGVPVVLVSGTQLAEAFEGRVAARLACVGSASRLAGWVVSAMLVAEALTLGVAQRLGDGPRRTHEHLHDLRARLGRSS